MSEVRLSTVIMVCVAFGVATYAVNSGSAAAENIWRKVKLASIGAVHMMFSKDKKFKPEVRAAAVAGPPMRRERRKVLERSTNC